MTSGADVAHCTDAVFSRLLHSLVTFVLFAVSSLQTMNGVQQLCLRGRGVLWQISFR